MDENPAQANGEAMKEVEDLLERSKRRSKETAESDAATGMDYTGGAEPNKEK